MIYKNNFIALYDNSDNCVFVTEEWNELAKFLGRTIESTQSSIAHIFKRKGNSIERKNLLFNGKKLTPYLFSVDSEED